VEEAHASGIRICEFPTTLAAAQAARRCGMATVMGSPNVVFGTSQSGNVSAREVAQAGLLDCVSSYYAPVSLLHAAFLLAGESEHDLPAAMAMVTVNPAALVGLHDRGAIVPGRRADLVRGSTARRHAARRLRLARRPARSPDFAPTPPPKPVPESISTTALYLAPRNGIRRHPYAGRHRPPDTERHNT
jgi:phosphonate metabolism protein PhnM